MKKPQAQIFLVDDLQKAKQERDAQIDDVMCSLEGIGQALDATAEGISCELARVFLANQLQTHLMMLREMVLPERV